MHPLSGKKIHEARLSFKTLRLLDFAPIFSELNSSIYINDLGNSGGALTFLALSMIDYKISELEALLVIGVSGFYS
jgi:hypothetical protein